MTEWQPIKSAMGDILDIAKHAQPPEIGEHVGRVYTLPDGRWLVLKFANPSGEPESFLVVPEPPITL